MVKKACYIILSAPVIYEKYGDHTKKVFRDGSIEWKQCDYVSGYWHEFEDNLVLDQLGVVKKLSSILLEIVKGSCEYHMDRHKFFSEILHRIKLGEKVFIRYVDENELILNKHVQKKYAEMVQFNFPLMSMDRMV